MIHKKNKNKGQISLEILAIIGMVVIGAIFLGTFYMSGLNKKTAEATAIEDPTDGMSKWVVDSNSLGSTDPIMISECGNDKVEGTEQCDGLDMGKYTYQTCVSLKFSSGNLSCNADCTLDTSNCVGGTTGSTCGNGTIQKSEQCDGSNLNGKTCVSLGYSGGNLECKSNCSFDLTTCSNLYCGDRICNNGEDSISCPGDCSDIPIANPPGSVYPTSQKVTLTSQTPGTIYYTTDGTVPTASSKKYTGPISITTDTNLYAKSFTTSWTESALMQEEYVLNEIATPVATPAGSAYLTPQTVSLTCLTPDANIYYSVQYSSGETSVKTLYTSPILISSNATIQAQAYKSGFDPSEIMTEQYIINAIATPVAKPVGGIYTTAQTVSLSSITSGTSIYYTLDGSTPTTSSTLYSATPIAISSTTILKAIAVKSGYNPSEIMTEKYTIADTIATPIASILTGTYTNNQTVSLSTTTSGAQIYYTIDGSTPTIESPLYLSPISIKFTTNLKAIAVKSNFEIITEKNDFEQSGILSETYTIIVAVPVASLLSGTSIDSVTVSLSTETIGATIYYTTNGSVPTTSSLVYSSPITLNATTTLKAVAYKLGYALSAVMSATYNINYILTYTAGPNGT
ncbi:MAG: chitobiase/beta-hexosaminidase C-terminal domain-containing protein, partial [archaeon]